jgi:hypothetical protein
MDKKLAGLLGAVATLGAVNAAQAAPSPSSSPANILRASSFAELLEPIPNAAAQLKALDEHQAQQAEGMVQLAQYYVPYDRPYYHHHHHHHHHAFYPRYYEPEVVIVPRYRRYYHHHHHHHHSFYRRDYY